MKSDANFTAKAGDIFDKITELAGKDISEDEIKKIAVSLIDVLAEHNLTYDQAHNILRVTGVALDARAMLMRI